MGWKGNSQQPHDQFIKLRYNYPKMLKICGEKKPLSNYSFKLGVMNTLKVRQYRQTIPVRWLKFYSFIKLKRDKKM